MSIKLDNRDNVKKEIGISKFTFLFFIILHKTNITNV